MVARMKQTSAPNVDWQPSREAGQERLSQFLPAAGIDYAKRRNFDLGRENRSNVSALSPWIRHALLDEADILRSVLDRHGAAAAEKFIQEVVWRGYFKGWLEHRPEVWDGYRADRDAGLAALGKNAGQRKAYGEAVDGRTGIEAFDHWARELVETGYLHNHARMWFASIWIFTLNLPWSLGADFFYRHLLDGDPASNTCSWRWVAGLHTPGKHYIARAENIAKFTEGRFDPRGQLNEGADPVEFATVNPDPVPPDLALALNDLEGAGWMLTPDSSVHVDKIDGPVAGLAMPHLRSPWPVSDAVMAFERAAMLERCGEGDVFTEVEALPVALGQWVQQQGLNHVVLPHISVGPYRELTSVILAALENAGVQVIHHSRPYDRALWPNAARGFFKLKSKLPSILRALDLA